MEKKSMAPRKRRPATVKGKETTPESRKALDIERLPGENPMEWDGVMSGRDRIAWIIERFEGGQNVRFARKIGTSKSSVTKLLAGQFNIGRYAEKILRAYPEVNARWLVTGEGDPLSIFDREDVAARMEGFRKEIAALREAVMEIVAKSGGSR